VASVNPSRRYESPLRDRAAHRTRTLVLDAAQDLFLEQGFARTTIEQIAERAEVSRPTVHTSVGNKRAILKELRDRALAGDDEPGPVMSRPWYHEALTEPDPARALALHARNLTTIYRRYAGLDEVLAHAAGADAELRDLYETSERQRRVGATAIVNRLIALDALTPDLDPDAAIDVLWTLSASDAYRRLVDKQGWPADRYEKWLATTFQRQFLADP
jgi:AcrR family transcriptional regulator